MNIVMIMAGGVGNRFQAVIPKQYNMVAGKPVIDYVIDAVEGARLVDQVVVVMDSKWIDYSRRIKESDYGIAPNGDTRIDSVYNGISFIHDHYDCDKLLILDAVAPFVSSSLIDTYLEKLDDYDIVMTTQRITGGLMNVNEDTLDREQYLITQSPEAFRFQKFWDNYDRNFPYQEMAGMLPQGTKIYHDFEFKNNLKLTYDFELEYARFVLGNMGKLQPTIAGCPYFDREVLVTEGIKSYLLRNETEKTNQWLDMIYDSMPELIDRWGITSFLPNHSSRFGLVLEGASQKYGKVVIKFIPEFVGRFERELEAMRLLSDSYMCPLLDFDEEKRVMLLKRIDHAKTASYEETNKLKTFFNNVHAYALPKTEDLTLNYIPKYYDELCQKLATVDLLVYCKQPVTEELIYAEKLYRDVFMDAPKYVLHGDLHELNILDDGERFWGIDPNGMWAPLELEFVRFIRNDVRNHPENMEARFDQLVETFTEFVDKERLLQMYIVDMAFCTYNSVFENETMGETLVDLELIRIAKERLISPNVI